jgi:hypothetical protein
MPLCTDVSLDSASDTSYPYCSTLIKVSVFIKTTSAIHTIRISTAGLGQVVNNAAISGRHEITNSMQRTQLIGQDIEVQITDTKIALYRAILDTLNFTYLCSVRPNSD